MLRKAEVAALLMLLPVGQAMAQAPVLGTPANGHGGVAIAKLKLSWLPVPNATAYVVEMATDAGSTSLVPIEKSIVSPSATRADVEYTVSVKKPEKLKPSTKYFWHVTPVCAPATSCQPTTSEPFRFTTTASTVTPIKLTQTVEGDAAAKPAVFKYAHSVDKGTIASADFALQWRGQEHFNPANTRGSLPIVYVESVIKSRSKLADTAVRIAGGGVFDYNAGAWGFTSHAVFRHESDQRFDTRKFVGTVDFTPAYDKLAIGTATNNGGAVPWLWEPTFSVVYGRTLAVGDSTEVQRRVERYAVSTDVLFFLDRVATLLNLDQVKLTISDKGWLLPHEKEKRRRNLFSTSIEFPVADKVSVGLLYKHGTDSPTFKRTHDYGLTVGIKLGK